MPARFEPENQSHLLKATYDDEFLARVYALRELSIDEFLRLDSKGGEYRISYESMDVYTSIAQRLKLMADSKAGVPRTAYLGIVTCFVRGNRVFITPLARNKWNGYDTKYQAPNDVLSPPVDANNNDDDDKRV